MKQPLVRAIFASVRVPGLKAPNDTAHLKIHYPAFSANSELERNSGLMPVCDDWPLLPIAILLPGINVGPEGLGWLARALSARGMVVVTYSLIGEELPGQISLTPGIDITLLGPDLYAKRPSALALGPIIAKLKDCNMVGILAGRLDLSKIALGGHSAGGTVALLNANPNWFPGVRAAFAYGAHTAAATMLGYAAGAMNMISDTTPVLIMGGTEDGVIAESALRYGDQPSNATQRVIATFEQSITRKQSDSFLAIITGANHFSIIDPQDDTTGRAFLDRPETANDPKGLIECLIWAFLAQVMELPRKNIAWAEIEKHRCAFSHFRQK